MDVVDGRIIEILKKNSRESFVDIAKHLELTEGAVRARVKKLVSQGVIRKFTIDTKEGIKAVVMVSISGHVPTTHIASQIKKMGIDTIYEVSGNYDIVCFIDAASVTDANNAVEKIKKIEGVTDTVTSLVLK
jgi:DNA-binding Lrp family transcriptional regulator